MQEIHSETSDGVQVWPDVLSAAVVGAAGVQENSHCTSCEFLDSGMGVLSSANITIQIIKLFRSIK